MLLNGLTFKVGKFLLEVLIEKNARFGSLGLRDVVVHKVEVNWVAKLVVTYQDKNRSCLEFNRGQKSVSEGFGELKGLPVARAIQLKDDCFVDKTNQVHQLLLACARLANQG